MAQVLFLFGVLLFQHSDWVNELKFHFSVLHCWSHLFTIIFNCVFMRLLWACKFACNCVCILHGLSCLKITEKIVFAFQFVHQLVWLNKIIWEFSVSIFMCWIWWILATKSCLGLDILLFFSPYSVYDKTWSLSWNILHFIFYGNFFLLSFLIYKGYGTWSIYFFLRSIYFLTIFALDVSIFLLFPFIQFIGLNQEQQDI